MLAPSDLSSLHTMRTEGFVELPYPDHLTRTIAIAVAAWKEFLALPDSIKKRFDYLPDTGNSGSGYEFPDAAKKDFKHVFHTKVKDAAWLYDQARRVGRDEATVLVSSSLKAIEELIPFVAEFCGRLEREFDVGTFRDDFLADTKECILRHLFYPPGVERDAGYHIAKRHVDKGGFTLHNWESHPGVERLTFDRKWVPFPTRKGMAVMFGSFRLQHRSKNVLKGLDHRVVLVPEAVRTGRHSTVFFSNFLNSPYYNKRKYGPMQDLPEGFTYDVSLEQLNAYFAPYEK